MKKKISLLVIFITLILSVFTLSACEIDAQSSIKSITKPYIAVYECIEAKLGESDILEKYDFIKITLIDKEKLEVSYKSKNGKKHVYTGNYTFDDKTRELDGEIGVIGIKFREKIKIEKGEFTLKKNILTKPLVIRFKAV